MENEWIKVEDWQEKIITAIKQGNDVVIYKARGIGKKHLQEKIRQLLSEPPKE